ncbi:MAG: LLM class F420-dependent oxidoreductase [Candidatus Binatus sp.]|jgi:probable F420-dependent oxidoreductase|uniref:LLM class F420-dependent oxidoreductase n=1 Tax=Candidatus Binatus sp. TaxID=2811406 RepID=UPI003D0E691B
MKFGTFLYQTSPNSIAAVARKAEESGFESLWIPEHIILPVTYRSPYPYSLSGRMGAPPETPLHDPMLALAFVAGITTKIRLATGVFVVPIRNAFATAKAVASLDVLSGGRFIFGVGIGWLEEEFDAVGLSFKDRALRTREYIALMKELWSKESPEYHGKTISIEGFKFMPKPSQKPHPPIVFGGNTEPSLKRAAKLGDGWYGIADGIDEIAATIKRLREHERAAGRTAPLELTVSKLREQLKPGDIQRFAAMGASRIIVAPGATTREQIASMEKFGAEVIARQ